METLKQRNADSSTIEMEGITKMTLYKYTPIEHIKSCIEKGIFASNLENINDPYEGKGIRYKDE